MSSFYFRKLEPGPYADPRTKTTSILVMRRPTPTTGCPVHVVTFFPAENKFAVQMDSGLTPEEMSDILQAYLFEQALDSVQLPEERKAA